MCAGAAAVTHGAPRHRTALFDLARTMRLQAGAVCRRRRAPAALLALQVIRLRASKYGPRPLNDLCKETRRRSVPERFLRALL